MQPSAPERVRFLKSALLVSRVALGLCALVLAAGLLAGCGDATSIGGPSAFTPPDTLDAPTQAEREAAITALESMKRSTFDSAFVRLADYRFRRTLRTERLQPGSDSVLAFYDRTFRYAPARTSRASSEASSGTSSGTSSSAPPSPRAERIAADSSGSFDASFLADFAPASAPGSLPYDLTTYAFPDDPAYLAQKTRSSFTYRLQRDTLEGVPVQIVEVRALGDGQGAEQSVRYARLTLHDATRQLLAAEAVRTERVLLFSEDSHFSLRLQQTPNGQWVPAATRLRARVDVPFRDPQEFRSVSTYTNVED
jgi:hypothetical protein